MAAAVEFGNEVGGEEGGKKARFHGWGFRVEGCVLRLRVDSCGREGRGKHRQCGGMSGAIITAKRLPGKRKVNNPQGGLWGCGGG